MAITYNAVDFGHPTEFLVLEQHTGGQEGDWSVAVAKAKSKTIAECLCAMLEKHASQGLYFKPETPA